ncbi:MAG: hypothetical protein ACRDGE_01440 [Candidatus Limnocylindria bacterium]
MVLDRRAHGVALVGSEVALDLAVLVASRECARETPRGYGQMAEA